MDVFHSILYGLIGGLSEFFPISPSAHQYLYSYLTGFSNISAFLLLMCQAGCLAAVIISCWRRLAHIRRELRLASLPAKRRRRMPDMQAVSDFYMMLTGLIPMILGLLLYHKVQGIFLSLPWLCLTLCITAASLFAGQFLPSENRDSRNMNRLEGLLLGLACAVSVIPGISRIAIFCYWCRQRKCSREYALELALLFSVPMILGNILLQMITLLSAGDVVSTDAVGGGLLAAMAAFAGGLVAIRLMRYFAVKMDFFGFAHYCFGLSVFSFLYYLMT